MFLKFFNLWKYTGHILVGNAGHFRFAHAISSSQGAGHFYNEGTLVALAPMGHRSHVGAVGFEHDARKGHHCRQVFPQMTTLKSGDTADAKHETGKAEKLKGLLPVAREAMEHTTCLLYTSDAADD